MKSFLSQIIIGVIVTVLGGFITHALVRGGHGKRAGGQFPVSMSDRR